LSLQLFLLRCLESPGRNKLKVVYSCWHVSLAQVLAPLAIESHHHPCFTDRDFKGSYRSDTLLSSSFLLYAMDSPEWLLKNI
jgi:hypothetical protein